MANGAHYHKWIDQKGGLSSGNLPLGIPVWAAATVYAAKAMVQNGNFLFSTVAGGTSAASGVGPTPLALTDNTVTWTLAGFCSGVAVSDVSPTTDIGYRALAKDYGPNGYGVAEFRYVKFTGATAIVAGSFVMMDRAAQTAVATPTAAIGAGKGAVLGIAMGNQALNVTSPLYGWVGVVGAFDGANVITTFTANATLSGSATAGAAIGNAAAPTANYSFDGALLRSGAAVGLCTVELQFPFVSGR